MIVNEIYIIRVVVGDDHGQDYFQFTMTILFVMTSGMNHVIISHISYVLYIKIVLECIVLYPQGYVAYP